MARIEELKKKYKGEWLAIEVSRVKNGEPIQGKLILHSKNREEIWKKIRLSRKKEIYVAFAGPPLEKGYVAAFYENK